MGTKKRIKALEQRVAALEGVAGAKVIEQDYRDEAPADDAGEVVTLGVWRRFAKDMWIRDGESREHFGSVWSFRDGWCASFGPHNEYDSVAIGTYPTRSAAMLATDARLREAGCVLPETATVKGVDLWIGDSCMWVASDGCPEVCRHDEEPMGMADTLTEALAILDAHKVDTAIARAQLAEREAEGPTILSKLLNLGTDTGHPDGCDPIATRKAAAEGRGWGHWYSDAESAGARHEIHGAIIGAGYSDLLDAIEAREAEATKPLPLAGVVLSSWVREANSGETWWTIHAKGAALLWHAGGWLIYGKGHCIATGIGTRADAIAKAEELGAEVAS